MKKAKHVVLIAATLNTGGAEKVLTNLANYLCKNKYRVTIITFYSQETFYLLENDIKLVSLNQKPNNSNGSIIRLVRAIKKFLLLRWSIQKILPDIVISFMDVPNIITLLASMGSNIPVIVSERTDPKYHRIYKVCALLRKLLYCRAKYIVAQTKAAGNFFTDALQHKVKIIANPVLLPSQVKDNMMILHEVKNVFTVGRLSAEKDHVTLIHAFARISNKYPLTRLIIYGDGLECASLMKLINNLKLNHRITLPGKFDNTNIYKILCNGDIFVFPSLYEGFPNALCEAMSVGLPVIASDCSGNLAIVDDRINGRLFSVGNVSFLSRILEELINDPMQRYKLAQEAKKVVYKYKAEKIFAQWEELLV